MNTVFSKYMLEEGYSMLITCTFFLIFRNIYIHQLNSCCIYHFLHIPVERNAPLKCLKMRRASDPWGEGKLTRKQSFWSQTPYGTPFWLIYDLRWVIPNIKTSHHVALVDITMSRHFRQRSMQWVKNIIMLKILWRMVQEADLHFWRILNEKYICHVSQITPITIWLTKLAKAKRTVTRISINGDCPLDKPRPIRISFTVRGLWSQS